MVRWDQRLETWIAAHRLGPIDSLARALSVLGTDGAVWLAISAIVALALRRWGPLLWVAVADALAQLATISIKTAFPRARPNVETIVTEPSTHSFPSGHAASSFACALVLGSFVPRFRVPLFVLAALIAASRAYAGVHFPSDVLAGALLGLLIGSLVLALRGATERRRSSSGPRAAQ
ncbi:MAG TPA: phosphatase PAP2 family protein [Gaiellaceae bacterium]|jgi:undecaprenyl-diphosphatase|nr:phosphatase PAP2 family protein [Gaiellaceae bacterium]